MKLLVISHGDFAAGICSAERETCILNSIIHVSRAK